MTHTDNHSQDEIRSQEAFEQMMQERMRYAVRVALISILEEEVTAFIGAKPYERNAKRRDEAVPGRAGISESGRAPDRRQRHPARRRPDKLAIHLDRMDRR